MKFVAREHANLPETRNFWLRGVFTEQAAWLNSRNISSIQIYSRNLLDRMLSLIAMNLLIPLKSIFIASRSPLLFEVTQ